MHPIRRTTLAFLALLSMLVASPAVATVRAELVRLSPLWPTVGDQVVVGIVVDNPDADPVGSLFTTIQFDPALVSLSSGSSQASILGSSGDPFIPALARSETAGAPKPGEPAGNRVALSYLEGVLGPATGVGGSIVAELTFDVIGAGPIFFSHVLVGNDEARVSGQILGPGSEDPSLLDLGPTLSFIPEPGTPSLIGVGLWVLGMHGRRRARRAESWKIARASASSAA